jgi:hypothetical protein
MDGLLKILPAADPDREWCHGSACKIVFTQRFKRAGMKWNIEGGQPILDLRVIAPSNLWPTTRTSDAGSQQRMTSSDTTPTGREPLQNC